MRDEKKITRTIQPSSNNRMDQSEMDLMSGGYNGKKDVHSFFSENVPKARQRNLESNPSTNSKSTKVDKIL